MARHDIELVAEVKDLHTLPPPGPLPELALAGRSNVGKSSLVNALLGRKRLAQVSRRPGKTRAIHLYRVDRRFLLSDLPGYGYAAVPLAERERWGRLIQAYFRSRTNLVGIIHLVDGRHPPQQADLALRDWLLAADRPFLVVATKIDKVKRSRRRAHLERIARELGLPDWRSVLPCSAASGEGIRELMREARALTEAVQAGREEER